KVRRLPLKRSLPWRIEIRSSRPWPGLVALHTCIRGAYVEGWRRIPSRGGRQIQGTAVASPAASLLRHQSPQCRSPRIAPGPLRLSNGSVWKTIRLKIRQGGLQMAWLVVSADSHVMEPPTLWTERLDRKFQDRAPKVVKNESGTFSFVAPGIVPFPVAAVFGIGKSGAELKEHLTKGYEAARPSGWDPAERLKDQDIDGVRAEVLYTTLGMPLFGLDDDELRRACFAVYNDWVGQFRSYNPK